MGTLLEVKNLGISFGSNHVLKSINFKVDKGEVLGVIGPNGAGKTVMLNILSGILAPTAGEIIFEGKDITNTDILARTKMGFGRTFQVPRSFDLMTAYENVIVGGIYGANMSEKEASYHATEIMERIGMTDKAKIFAGKLSLLDRKRLEIGVALASNPKMLLLDEVAGGLTESETETLLDLVESIKAEGVSIIWIEHIIETMVRGTDRVILVAQGEVMIEGKPLEVMESKVVEEVYLGVDDDDED